MPDTVFPGTDASHRSRRCSLPGIPRDLPRHTRVLPQTCLLRCCFGELQCTLESTTNQKTDRLGFSVKHSARRGLLSACTRRRKGLGLLRSVENFLKLPT